MESDSKALFNNERTLITFGKYKGELLKWLVIDEKDDKIFLLSIVEADKYFAEDADRVAGATEYALSLEPYKDDYSDLVWWCLRSPGDSNTRVAVVHWSGFVYEEGVSVCDDGACIRPSLWVEI